ncbi:MAG: hypothetical protein Q4A01_05060 [Coriobacteriales bacterium]|nr:hypothetical protein [Coriobacteriales bacterium]
MMEARGKGRWAWAHRRGAAKRMRHGHGALAIELLMALALALSPAQLAIGALSPAGERGSAGTAPRGNVAAAKNSAFQSTQGDEPSQGGQPAGGPSGEEGEGNEGGDNGGNNGGDNEGENPGQDQPAVPPSVEVTCDAWDACRLVADRAYAATSIELQVSVEADDPNLQESTVCGIPIVTLVEKGQGQERTTDGLLCFAGWSASDDEGGRTHCQGTIELREGSYQADSLVQVADERGERASFAALAEQQVRLLVVDESAPRVAILGVADDAQLRAPTNVVVQVRDERWDEVADFDGHQVVVTVTKDGTPVQEVCAAGDEASQADGGSDYAITIPARPSHEDDGVYGIVVRAADLAGNESARESRTVVVDTTPPRLQVDLSFPAACAQVADGALYKSPVIARVLLWEHNLSLADLADEQGPVNLAVQATRGGVARMVDTGAWEQEDDHFVRRVCFASDGTFALEVRGRDRAGNPMVGGKNTHVDESGAYACESFVIDLTDPVMSMTCDPAPDTVPQLAGRACYAKPVRVEVCVQDRNFDPEASTITNSLGTDIVADWSVVGEQDGVVTYAATLVYCEETCGLGAGYKHVEALACDLAGHEAQDLADFVVDQTAPVVQSADVSKRPIALWPTAQGGAPVYFYHERDGMPTTLSLSLGDEFGLADAWVDDPDGAYSGKVGPVAGKTSATITLRLKDHVAHDAHHDTAFDRDVRLFVRDVAGNVRVWTLGGKGGVYADRTEDAWNVSLGGESIHPQALVNDIVAPQVTLSGVSAREYYAQEQQVVISVEEDGFAWLQRLDAGRVVATVTKRAGSASGERTSWDIPVSSFTGAAPSYACAQPLADDGHYVVTAQLTDASGNVSAPSMIEEFTIDKTAPLVSVEWDNNDVRNGKYYRAARTATITVIEHNFSPQNMAIRTTGSVGTWTEDGDTHRCDVSFATDATADAPHQLRVEGTDLAGNAAAPYTSPNFVLDTQPPVVSIGKVTSTSDGLVADSPESELLDRSAFAQALRPIVRCADEANLDVSRTSATLRCERRQTASEDVDPTTMPGNNEVGYAWQNLGMDESEGGYRMDGDGIYTVTAQAVDLAGNESPQQTVTFSLNRFGSTFFVEGVDDSSLDSGDSGRAELLTAPPQIVVHEINVCGQADNGDAQDAHLVTKDHAFATTQIVRTDQAQQTGYTFELAQDEGDDENPDGWREYVYTIASGNFGKGSDSDYGDGGQGLYRVDVSSVDAAGNRNTTAAYWKADANQEASPHSSTASFVLDEEGPAIEDVTLPDPVRINDSGEVWFYVHDEVGRGDTVQAWVDGQRVDVWREGANQPVADGELAEQGRYWCRVEPRPAWVPRSLRIEVADYTGSDERTCSYQTHGFVCTAGWLEALVALAAVVAAIGCTRLVHGALARRVKGGRHGWTD